MSLVGDNAGSDVMCENVATGSPLPCLKAAESPEVKDCDGPGSIRLEVMNEQLAGVMKEISTFANDIRSIRVATHRGFQDLEKKMQDQCQDVVKQVHEEVAKRSDDMQRLEQQLGEVRCSPDRMSLEGPPAPADDTVAKFDLLQEELKALTLDMDRKLASIRGEMKQECISAESSSAPAADSAAKCDSLQQELRELALKMDSGLASIRDEMNQDRLMVEGPPALAAEIAAKFESMNEELRTLTLETDRRLASIQDEIKQETTNQQVSGTQFAQQLLDLTEAVEKQATFCSEGSESHGPATAVADDLRQSLQDLASQTSERSQEMMDIGNQVKDLRLCLEAEVGARSAITERLHREVHDLRNLLDEETSVRISGSEVMPGLQPRVQCLEASMQEMKNMRLQMEELLARKTGDDSEASQQRGASIPNLDIEVLKEGFKELEAQAKKHVSWVEAQAEKHAVRQEAFEKSIGQEAQARASMDGELRQYIVNELSAQAQFFKGELKGLLASAHSSFTDEIRKLWNVVEGQGTSAQRSHDSSSGRPAASSAKDEPQPSANPPPSPACNLRREAAAGMASNTSAPSRSRDVGQSSTVGSGSQQKPGQSFLVLNGQQAGTSSETPTPRPGQAGAVPVPATATPSAASSTAPRPVPFAASMFKPGAGGLAGVARAASPLRTHPGAASSASVPTASDLSRQQSGTAPRDQDYHNRGSLPNRVGGSSSVPHSADASAMHRPTRQVPPGQPSPCRGTVIRANEHVNRPGTSVMVGAHEPPPVAKTL